MKNMIKHYQCLNIEKVLEPRICVIVWLIMHLLACACFVCLDVHTNSIAGVAWTLSFSARSDVTIKGCLIKTRENNIITYTST